MWIESCALSKQAPDPFGQTGYSKSSHSSIGILGSWWMLQLYFQLEMIVTVVIMDSASALDKSV